MLYRTKFKLNQLPPNEQKRIRLEGECTKIRNKLNEKPPEREIFRSMRNPILVPEHFTGHDLKRLMKEKRKKKRNGKTRN